MPAPPSHCSLPLTHLHAQTDGGQLQLLLQLQLQLEILRELYINVLRVGDEEKWQTTKQGGTTDATQRAGTEATTWIPYAAPDTLYGHITIHSNGHQYQAAGHDGGSVDKRHKAAHEAAQRLQGKGRSYIPLALAVPPPPILPTIPDTWR